MTPFFMAWGMFCALPCPVKKWDSSRTVGMLLCFPLIGLLIGTLWSGAALLVSLWGKGMAASLLLGVFPALLSGFIHLDGFMDCADAVLSRRDLPERQRILKDSRVGAFAVIALVLWALSGFALFADMPLQGRELCLLFLPAAVRSVTAFSVLTLSPMASSSYAALPRPVSRGKRLTALGEALLFSVLPLVLCGLPGLAVPVAAVVTALAVFSLSRNLGGMNGDISGCALTLGELAGVLALTLL